MFTNIQGKVRAAQIRTVKYKFTKATDKMKSLGLIGPYDSTEAFVEELGRHLKLAKICDSNHLRGCWPYDKIILSDGSEYDITQATTGEAFKRRTTDSQDFSSPNVGIVTADGTPMILSYNKKCAPLDPAMSYGWSTEDNKPVTNATTNCVAAIFEINGTKKPNKFKQDVIAFNATGLGSDCTVGIGAGGRCFSAAFSPTPVTVAECEEMVRSGKYGIKGCNDIDYWAGAVKQCGGVDNMPTMDDLAEMASAIYEGNPSIGAKEHVNNLTYKEGTASSLGLPEPYFVLWSNAEIFSNYSYCRGFDLSSSNLYISHSCYRNASSFSAVCLSD